MLIWLYLAVFHYTVIFLALSYGDWNIEIFKMYFFTQAPNQTTIFVDITKNSIICLNLYKYSK